MNMIPETVGAAIEAERARLFQANGILDCAALAVREHFGSPADAPDIEAAIDAARALISSAVCALDSVALARAAVPAPSLL